MPDQGITWPEDTAVPYEESIPWQAWSPREAAAQLAGVRTVGARPIRWAVAGGWALDVFLGRVTREHEDLEIAVLNDDVPAVLALYSGDDWHWVVPHDGFLHPLHSEAFEQTHQSWLWSHTVGAFVLDVFRDSHEGETWICRRDPTIRRPWKDVVRHSSNDVPYLIPEIVLLFKAKASRPKDLADLHAVLPSLDPDQRTWLRELLARVHPGHQWLDLI